MATTGRQPTKKAAPKKDLARAKVARAVAGKRRSNTVTLKPAKDSDILERLSKRFQIIEKLSENVLTGKASSLILSGPAGVGKTYTVDRKIAEVDPHGINIVINKGYVRPTALFKALWACKEKGQVAVFDDADSVFQDLNSLNMLKAALDTSPVRTIVYGSEYLMVDDNGQRIPHRFEMAGSAIFITNYDFDEMITKKHKFARHFEALMSRSHYVSLEMKTKRDYLVRVRQIVGYEEFRSNNGIDEDQAKSILEYLEKNYEKMRELSARSAKKLADLLKSDPDNWRELADITCLIV
jgi:predicted AAA+ superfamily ATPase